MIGRITFNGIVILLCVFLLAPTVVIFMSSFGGAEIIEFPPQNLTFRWYIQALQSEQFVSAARNSLWIAVAATAISAPLAILAAVGIVRGNLPFKEPVQLMLMSPLIVPSLVIGLSILLASTMTDLRAAIPRLVLAHALIVLPYLVRTVTASLVRVDPLAEEAARVLGANSARTFWHVTLPAVMPGLVAGMIFSFIISFDNVSISLFLANARTNTLPLALMSYVEYNLDASVAAVSSMLVAMALVVAVVLERTFGLGRTLGA